MSDAVCVPGVLSEGCLDKGYLLHGHSDLVQFAVGWFIFWLGLFYTLVFTENLWLRKLPSSSKKHENNTYWCVMQGEQPWCSVPDQPFTSQYEPLESVYVRLGVAGLAFTMHIVSDLVTSVLHGIATVPQVIHHIAFICVGLILRTNCFLPFNAAALMAMEASTPFLNFLMVFRNRGEGYARMVQIASYFFIAAFIIFRLILNTYCVVLLWRHRDSIVPEDIPRWQAWSMILAISAGALIQYFFFWQIVQSLGDKAKGKKIKCEDENNGTTAAPRKLSDHINADGKFH